MSWLSDLWRRTEKTALGTVGLPPSMINSVIGTAHPYDQGQLQAGQNAAMTRQQEQGALNDLQTALPNIPQTLRTGYLADAQRAGTYGNTPAWQRSLDSEVQAGTRGARVDNIARQNSLRSQLGMDPLPPEQSGDLSTDANQQGIANQNATAAQTATNVANASSGTQDTQPQQSLTGGINPMAIGTGATDSNNAVTQRQNAIGNRLGGTPKPANRGPAIGRKLGGML